MSRSRRHRYDVRDRSYLRARSRVRRRIGFLYHLIPYLFTYLFLLSVAGFKVAIIVGLLWGIGLASHWLWVLAPDLRERWIAQELARREPPQPLYPERVWREL